MSFVDDRLLGKLVDKYGLEKEAMTSAKSKLWGKVTREYNQITGNAHTKAKLNKKWQNIKHQRKLKRKKLWDQTLKAEAAAGVEGDAEDTLEDFEKSAFLDVGENMWNANEHTLRDLFLYLVQKHHLDEVTNPRLKNELWKNVVKDFHSEVENVVYIKHEKFTKKWQNWKQYNKIKGKPHPFEMGIELDFDIIREKVRKLKERAASDASFAAMLARESDERPVAIGLGTPTGSGKGLGLAASSEMDLVSGGASLKQLEREVFMEALRCEQERSRIVIENGRLESDKLKRETEMLHIQLQLAQADLALKRQECEEKGLVLQ